ncbi:hypothetical protein ABN028_19365 [Actinopolymorpha sp. B17G11]|uniref:hypothetical protein n=1 Tax=Actinopolymorpha sp. B17G11 TaxID=3160861 RepID=UPI0032E4ED43
MSVLAKLQRRSPGRRYGRSRDRILQKAAGVSRVEIICDTDTWHFITKRARCCAGAQVDQEDSTMVRGRVSGPDLVDLLVTLGDGSRGGVLANWPEDMRAIAGRVYDIVAEAVQAVDLDSKDGKRLPPIEIDHRVADAG